MLPPDRLFPDDTIYEGPDGTVERVLGGTRSALVSNAARRFACTPFACIVAALFRGLHRLTGARDLAILTPAANRGAPILAHTVGLVTNPILLRYRADDEPLADTIGAVWREARSAYRHAACPLEIAIDALERIGRRPDGVLAQVHLRWNNMGLARLDFPGVAVTPVPGTNRRNARGAQGAVPLHIDVVHGPGGLAFNVAFRPNAIDVATADRLLGLLTEEIDGLAAG